VDFARLSSETADVGTGAMNGPQVLIVGAGPTGLNLALWLRRLGVSVRIVDKASGPGETSRALAVQARTLEFYRQLGFAQDVVQRGIVADDIRVRLEGTLVGGLNFGDRGDAVHDLSPYPYVLMLPQDEHERILTGVLGAAGLEVEWNTALTAYEDDGSSVRVALESPRGSESVAATYVCGCDGAHSLVRHSLGIGFPGGTYDSVFYVADVRGRDGALEGGVNFCVGGRTFCITMPARGGATRLVGLLRRAVSDDRPPEFAEVADDVAKLSGATITDVDWFSAYRVHHRVAERFRRGNGFLLGDAGHIHSPAGGQGMNTGIGDAANLAWKLAAVLQARATPEILDTYETERLPFARSLVATTDRVFESVVGDSLFDRTLRTTLMPRLVPELLNIEWLRVQWFRVISQTRIEYRKSALSQGAAGAIHGGDRLPWADGPDGGNFAPLSSLDWQIHVYGNARSDVRAMAGARAVPVRELPADGATLRARIEEDALYLVRPDGYVALAQTRQDAVGLQRYFERFALKGCAA
jgi:2-polyprenyl-6-methoxyphenol hydroxylase-like FAD-dependent oxidoreductase